MSHVEPALQKAVFLDKDGTLIKDIPFNVDPALVEFEIGVFDGLLKLQKQGYKLIIITNQSGISSGHFSITELNNLAHFFNQKFEENGLVLSGFYYCPHLPAVGDNACVCRKPMPGLFFEAADELHIDLGSSWMIGDILNDVEAGNRAGCKTILINNGNETEWLTGAFRQPTFIADNFPDATTYITSRTI